MSNADDYSLGTVEVSLTPLKRFEEFLQSRGKRFTQQRRALVEHVFRRHEHFDADELTDELSRRGGKLRMGRATVYRTLTELVDAGLLRKLTIGTRAVYEHDYGYPQHDHLHCQKCDKLIEFRSEELLQLRDAVAREHQFRVIGHRLIVSGICKDCDQAQRRHRRRPLDLV
jgi:Fur family ferric uptake transcriptional regulator